MREHPILFSGEMVHAILDGRKSVTRRVVKPQVPGMEMWAAKYPNCYPGWASNLKHEYGPTTAHFCPYGQPGDRLWVREAWAIRADADNDKEAERWFLGRKSPTWYPADGETPSGCAGGMGKTRPSIHMPRWASRLTLEVTGVRVERLQDITEGQAVAEGVDTVSMEAVPRQATMSRRADFKQLWDRLSAKRGFGWDKNPWVFVIEFKRVEAKP